MQNKNLLPIGTVVKLNETEKRLMIVGILIQNEDTRYDYIGLLYPEGYIDGETMFMFNQEDIEKIEYIGFIDAECQAFRKTLYEELAKAEGND